LPKEPEFQGGWSPLQLEEGDTGKVVEFPLGLGITLSFHQEIKKRNAPEGNKLLAVVKSVNRKRQEDGNF